MVKSSYSAKPLKELTASIDFCSNLGNARVSVVALELCYTAEITKFWKADILHMASNAISCLNWFAAQNRYIVGENAKLGNILTRQRHQRILLGTIRERREQKSSCPWLLRGDWLNAKDQFLAKVLLCNDFPCFSSLHSDSTLKTSWQ